MRGSDDRYCRVQRLSRLPWVNWMASTLPSTVQQVGDGNRFPGGRGGEVVLSNGVVELEFALLHEA